MSFVLEFRKKYFVDSALPRDFVVQRGCAEPQAFSARPGGAASLTPSELPLPPRAAAHQANETRRAWLSALLALVIAAGILAVFNSEGLYSYTRDLAETRTGRPIFAVAERWDAAMERLGTKQLTADIRDMVQRAQDARWEDVAALMGEPQQAEEEAPRKQMVAEEPSERFYTGALPARAAFAMERQRRHN